MRFLIFSIMFALILCASYTDPPIEQVSLHNQQIANSLLHFTENKRNVNTTKTDFDNPIEFLDLVLLSPIPSVDNKISSNKETKILWAWGEQHAAILHKTIMNQNNNNCGDTTITREVSGDPTPLSINVLVELQNIRKSIEFYQSQYPNPFSLQLTKDELNNVSIVFSTVTNKSVPLEINITIFGKFAFPYRDTAVYKDYSCTWRFSELGYHRYCACIQRMEITSISIIKNSSFQSRYLLENSNTVGFFLHPILHEQTYLNPKISHLIFSRRDFYKLFIFSDDNLINGTYKANFDIFYDTFNIWYIKSKVIDNDLSTTSGSYINELIVVNNSNYSVPTPLDSENLSYTRSYLLSVNYTGQRGSQISIVTGDYFNDSFNFTYDYYVKQPTLLTLNTKPNLEEKTIEVTGIISNRYLKPLQKTLRIKNNIDSKNIESDSEGSFSTKIPLREINSSTITVDFLGDNEYLPNRISKNINLSSMFLIDIAAFKELIILFAFFLGMHYLQKNKLAGVN